MVEPACQKKSYWAKSKAAAVHGWANPSARAARSVSAAVTAATTALVSRAAWMLSAAGPA